MDTFTKQKTIKMPGELADKWIAALRSGEYKQGKMALSTRCPDSPDNDTVSYCCLGVLQMVVDGKVETHASDVVMGLPTVAWTNKFNIASIYNDPDDFYPDDFIPVIADIANLNVSAPQANDELNWSFAKIADHLEHCIERT